MRLLITKGANVAARNNDGITALLWSGCVEIVGMLLDHGADCGAKNNYGDTLLMMSSVRLSHDVAEFWLERGEDINARDMFGWTALMQTVLGGTVWCTRMAV